MAELRAQQQRHERLSSLDLQYPLWLFDIDDPRWPRRLDSLLPGSYPAKIAGWYASTSEYDIHLDRPQDLSYAREKNKGTSSSVYYSGLARDALQQLRYDDRFCLESLQAVVQHSDNEATIGLEDRIFDQDEPGWINPSRLIKIERTWDRVPIWDPALGLERLSDFEAIEPLFGVAILLSNDADLVAASGMPKTYPGEAIRKAKFERLDVTGRLIDGIVCPSRWREPGHHGIAINQGSASMHNRRLIAGTALQDAGWQAVVQYRQWWRRSPLL